MELGIEATGQSMNSTVASKTVLLYYIFINLV